VRLSPEREGLRIIVELKGATPGLLQTAGRVQELVKERVESHVGVKVNQVEVQARSLRSGRVEAEIEEAPPEGGPSEGE
jgi:uncharacterized alkaline shock family protein YloU